MEEHDSNPKNGRVSDKQNNELGTISENEDVNYDQLLSSAGEFGLYQFLLFISSFPFYIFGGFSYFTQLFITEVSPNHWCWIPELANLSEIDRRTLAIPKDDSPFGYSRCQSYVANWTDILSSGVEPDQSWITQPCQNGWEFNKTEIPYPTISSEMGWVCDKGSYQATAQSIFFVGSIIGGLIVGLVADRFGRLPATVFSNMIGCIAGVLSIFAQNFLQFAICRFFMGMSYDNCFMMVYLLILEYVAPKYRSLMSNLPFSLFFTFGLVSLPWLSKACGHWITISLVTSIPMAISLLVPFVMPESPRWLLSKGRTDDAVKKIVGIGRINKKPVSAKMIEQFKSSIANKKTEAEAGESILKLLQRPILRRIFICSCLEFMCCMMVFDGLVRNLGQLGFDFFLSFTVVSFTECPSLMLISFILDWTGRKWLSVVTLTISCIFSLLTAFVGNGLPSVMCAVVARFSVNMAANTGMQWATEMLPTSSRGSGMSIIHIFGYIGAVISPLVAYLEIYISWLPLVITAAVAGCGAILAFFLPETAHKDMPQTFEDAENFIKNSKIFALPTKKVQKERLGQVNNAFELN